MPPFLTDQQVRDVVLEWQVVVRLPLDGHWSKNRIWRRSPRGGTYLAPWALRRRDALTLALQADLAAGGHRARQNRVWLGIHAAKPHHGMDALNVLDLVADAVQLATGVDDRWFALAGLTWSLDPADPHLLVAVGQEPGLADVAACRRCGGLWSSPAGTGPMPQIGDCPVCRPAKGPRVRRQRQAPEPPVVPGDRPPW